MSSINNFTRSRPSQTRNMMDWNQPGEEASPCGIIVYSHRPSWVHAAVRGIESLSMLHWRNPLMKSVVLNTPLSPLVLREDRRPLDEERLELLQLHS